MKATVRGRRAAELALLWLLPASLVLSAWLWSRQPWMTGALLFYLVATPALAMTINVVIGAGVFRMWRFNLPYAVAGVAPQIGFIYAAVINLVMLGLAGLLTTPGPAAALAFVVLTALITALLGVLYDVIAVHFGLLDVYVGAHFRNESAWAIVRSYGFRFFGFIGLLAALSARLGYWLLVEQSGSPWWFVFALGVVIMVLPCIALLAAGRRSGSRQVEQSAS